MACCCSAISTKIGIDSKNNSITLRDLSQLIGYSRVANPKYSFLLSPQGISDSLKTLLLTYNRLDVLNYGFKEGKISDSIIIAKWNADANNIDFDTIITGTGNRIGNL